MKIRFAAASATCLLATACGPFKAAETPKSAAAPATTRLTLVAQDSLASAHPVPVLAKLTDIKQRIVVSADQLQNMNGTKVTLLSIDPSLNDFQQISAQPDKLPGVYSFMFKTQSDSGIRVWADIIPNSTGKEEFAMADLIQRRATVIDKRESHEASVAGAHFVLNLKKPPVRDSEAVITIEGQMPDSGGTPQLYGFYDDYRTVVHLTAEPSQDGSSLHFSWTPAKEGFVKFFLRLSVHGTMITVPFGVNVAASS